MDSTNAAQLSESMKNAWGQQGTHCLHVPLILRRVLQHLPTADLLEVSLVSKQWNYEARSVLQNQNRLTAMTISYPFCAVIRSFASDLRQMNVIPFSELSIEMVPRCNEYLICELDPVYKVFLERLPLKQLSVRSYRDWYPHSECPAFVLCQKILNKFGSVLEEFSLTLGSKERKVFVETLQDCTSFSKLKILKLKDEWGTREEKTNLIRILVSLAPNLQVLYSHGHVNLMEILPEGSSVAHVTDHDYCSSIYEIPERVLGQLQMQRIKLDPLQYITIQRINRVIPVLLKNSTVSLNSIEMNLTFLVPFSCYGVSLENVEELKLFFSSDHFKRFHPQVLRAMKIFDFRRIFPSLRQVHSSVVSYPNAHLENEDMIEMIEQQNAKFNEPMPDRAVNIKSLNLSYSSSADEFTVPFFTEMFPHIENLSVAILEGLHVPYNLLWQKPWVQLKELEIITLGNNPLRRNNVSLDSVLCGIFPEEVAELQQQDKEYLRRVNFVPVMPSISCLKGLTTFKLFFCSSFRASTDDIRFLISRVTGLIVFERSPDLLVTLGTDDEIFLREMRHRLLPYASVVRGIRFSHGRSLINY